MSIGFGQILVILVIALILFGKFPGLSKDLLNGLMNIQQLLKQKQSNNTTIDSELPKEIKSLDDMKKDDSLHDNSKK